MSILITIIWSGKSLCHMYHVQTLLFSEWEMQVYRIHFCDWYNGLTSVALIQCTQLLAIVINRKWLNVSPILGWGPFWRNPVFSMKWTLHILNSSLSCEHLVKDSLLYTSEVHGLNQLISLNGVPTLKFCNTFWAIYVVITSPPLPVCDTVQVILAVWHPLLIMVVAQSLHSNS